jgi:tetratricopeptide (TPR) repeat protein
MILDKLSRQKEALEAFDKAVEIKPHETDILINYADLLFYLGDYGAAGEKVENTLEQSPDHLHALQLKGRIQIENKKYLDAAESFKKIRSLNLADPNPILWESYAGYLNIKYSKSVDVHFEEELNRITGKLERVVETTGWREQLKTYFLYYLGFFYYRNNDYYTAKEKLKNCMELNPCNKLKKKVVDLLDHIWKHKIDVLWWHRWLKSPFYGTLNKILFVFIIMALSGLLAIFPFISGLSETLLQVGWPMSALLVLFFIFIVLSPSMLHSKRDPSGFYLLEPPASEPRLSTIMMKLRSTGIRDPNRKTV